MAVISTRVEDPRDRLEKATRLELWRFAQENGVNEITPEMPAMLMRPILRRRGLTNISVPRRELGSPRGSAVSNNSTVAASQADATADLARQWQQEKIRKEDEKATEEMSFMDLRKALKAKGVKFSRRDNMQTLREKWRGENAAERGQ